MALHAIKSKKEPETIIGPRGPHVWKPIKT